MEILQNIWTALTSENEILTKFLVMPTTFIEMTLSMLIFTTFLNITANKSQKIKYVISITIFAIFSLAFIPQPYNTFINMIAFPIFIHYLLKATILKSILSEFLFFLITAVLESLIISTAYTVFGISSYSLTVIPIYRIIVVTFLYISMFLVYFILKYTKFNVNMSETSFPNRKLLFAINFVIATIIIGIQFYLLYFYSNTLPAIILIFSILMLISYLCISIYSMHKNTQLLLTEKNLRESKLYNKTLLILHDNIRAFKHDFSNIVQSIGGYISTGDMDGLKTFYSHLLTDCQDTNNLNVLNPIVINDSAIFNLITAKYHKALDLGIRINLEIFLDLKTLNMKIYEFTRIFGILLDNAIEATCECETKSINVIIKKDPSSPRQLAIVENTYNEKDIDTEKIYEKGYSSKPNNTGLGLWKVRQILKCNSNLNLYTSKTDEIFSQQLEIYLPS